MNENKAGLARRSQTDPENKMRMMAVLIQNPVAFSAIVDHLEPEMFSAHDTMYAVLWRVVIDFHEEYAELPDYELTMALIQAEIAEESELLNDTEVEELSQFLDWAFDEDSFKKGVDGKAYEQWSIKAAKAFMQEQVAVKTRELVFQNNTVPADLPQLLGEQQRKSDIIETIDGGQARAAFPTGWDETAALKLTTTGIPFLDRFLGGGHTGGELYGLLGPYGSCKTTLALMLLVEGAKAFRSQVAFGESTDERIPLAFVVSYESRTPELRNRTVGYAAKVQRRSLETMEGTHDLSQNDSLLSYEKKMFRNKISQGKKVLGEEGRVKKAAAWMNQHVVFLDMTGYDEDHRSAGGGGLKEIARRITTELRGRPNTRCGLVIVDYVGAMVKRQMAANDLEESQMRHLISGAPLSAKSLIGDQFDCPIWLLHQLSGAANARGEGVKMHHTDSGEAKNFAENLDFAVVLGNPNLENLCTAACTKHRRQPPLASTIIKIDGAMNRVLDMDDKFVLDSSTRKIMSRGDQGRLPTLPDEVTSPTESTTVSGVDLDD